MLISRVDELNIHVIYNTGNLLGKAQFDSDS